MTDIDELPKDLAPLWQCLRPWYLGLDECIHRGIDPWLAGLPGYWSLRMLMCDYVDRRLIGG